jgi:hypothetical protein
MAASGEVWQATYQAQADGQSIETVLHFRALTPSTTVGDIQTSADFFWTMLSSCQSSLTTYRQLILKQMTPIAFDEFLLPPVSAIQGSVGGALLNTTLACILTKRTGVAGKTHRGRIYIGGISANDATVNLLNTSGITRFSTTIASIMTRYGPSGTDTALQLGVYSRVIGGTSPFTVAGWQPVTRLDLQTVLGNQRRRRFGVGI